MVRLLVLGLGWLCMSANADLNFSGYVKSYNVAQDEIDSDIFELDKLYKSQISSRFMLDYFNDNQVWQLHYEVGIENNSQSFRLNTAFPSPGDNYRLTDLPPVIGPDDEKNSIPQNLDRFNVQFQLNAGDLTIGRQAITFGSARIINPTDVFLPFDVRALNTEYRVGIDAIRFQKPAGQLGEIDMGVVLGENGEPENSAAFLQFQTNVSGSDLQFSLMRFTEQNLIGTGIQSSLWDLGYWVEAAYVTGDDTYTRASIGVDYALSKNIFAMIEYHYNGAGSTDPNDYLSQQTKVAYQSGGVFLLGKNYLIPVLSYQASALLSLSMQTIWNLDDSSLFFNLGADYNVADNLYLGLGLYLFSGDDFTLNENQQFSLGSEYGGSPNSIILNLRYYY